MQDMITRAWVSMETKAYMLKNRARNFKEEIKNDERGVGAMVATILIMLIVVLLAAVFWEKIKEWFDKTMTKIFGSEGLEKIGN
ncbi:MAG: hypothetical protein IKY52_08600 [Clostridia bacterium]|nr:hypothetical protein [Clostridia bacterium]